MATGVSRYRYTAFPGHYYYYYYYYGMAVSVYAHIEVLVTFLLVNFFSFLVITRSHELRIGPNLVQILPMGLPELFQQPRTLYNSQKVEILKSQFFENPPKS